jgi:protein gp37
MSSTSTIEWTESTWNPVTGCTKVSPGCDHCYAERITERFHGIGSFATVQLHPDRLDLPLKWRRPRRVFVNSMSDMFHADVPREFIGEVFDRMASAPRHVFQVLTKRAERMERVVRWLSEDQWNHDASGENVWLGVSVESPDYYARIRHLQRTPAAVRFLSLEPLLAPLPDLPLDGIHWVIVGGESGPGARAMHPDWVRAIRDQCTSAGVAFFFKQWGAWQEYTGREVKRHIETIWQWPRGTKYGPTQIGGHIAHMNRVGKHASGRELDGRTWDEMPTALPVPTPLVGLA